MSRSLPPREKSLGVRCVSNRVTHQRRLVSPRGRSDVSLSPGGFRSWVGTDFLWCLLFTGSRGLSSKGSVGLYPGPARQDLSDGPSTHTESTPEVDTVGLSVGLFEGLYANQTGEPPRPPPSRRPTEGRGRGCLVCSRTQTGGHISRTAAHTDRSKTHTTAVGGDPVPPGYRDVCVLEPSPNRQSYTRKVSVCAETEDNPRLE